MASVPETVQRASANAPVAIHPVPVVRRTPGLNSAVSIAWLKRLLFVLCLMPLARLVLFAFTGGLGANPIEFVIRSLGDWAITFLLVTLSVTPLRRLTGWNSLIRVRRMLGLFAFFYASLHFLFYVGVDQFFDFGAIVQDIVKRPFITLGFACLLALIPLAVTSTNAMQRRLGGKRWVRLHRLVYGIALGGVLHYWWMVKRDITVPLIYGLLLIVLLGVRLAWRAQARFSRPTV